MVYEFCFSESRIMILIYYLGAFMCFAYRVGHGGSFWFGRGARNRIVFSCGLRYVGFLSLQFRNYLQRIVYLGFGFDRAIQAFWVLCRNVCCGVRICKCATHICNFCLHVASGNPDILICCWRIDWNIWDGFAAKHFRNGRI